MIKKTLLALSIVAALAAVSPAYAVDKVCAIATASEFYSANKNIKPTYYKGSAKALKIMLDAMNTGRAEKGLFLYEADEVVIGIWTNAKGITMVGIVMFKDGCMVPGSVTAMNIEVWVKVAVEMGLEFSEFSKMSDA